MVVKRLSCPAPFDGPGLLAFFAARLIAGIEEYELPAGVYRRSLRLPHGSGVVELRPWGSDIEATFHLDDEGDIGTAVARCRALLDLESDPADAGDALGDDPLLGALVRAAPGVRVPGQVDGHELAVRAVLGQQVSLAGAATLAARLVAAHGEPLGDPVGSVTHTFPAPESLAAIDPATLAMPATRSRALLSVSKAFASGHIEADLSGDHEATRAKLLALPGIGPWTVEYVAMRGLRDPDAFMASDLGVRHALERLGLDGSPRAAERTAEAWRPYRAYALQYLWRSLAG